MSKTDKRIGILGNIITWALVILLLLGITGGTAYFLLRSQGVTFYVEHEGKKCYANADGAYVNLKVGEISRFDVKTLTGGEVGYSVKVTASNVNNFTFTANGEEHTFYTGTTENDDYTDVFEIERGLSGFSVAVPERFTVKKAVEAKYGGEITLNGELNAENSYFILTVTAETSVVKLWLIFSSDATEIFLNPPTTVF